MGRAGQRAYAYLFHPKDVELSEDAYERLKTIGEATELGSGFRIAMRDLELRGAGNLLGTGQSGHIAAVGYDLYCQMVVEALAELNGEEIPIPAEIKIDLPIAANISPEYIAREDQRVDAYRRLDYDALLELMRGQGGGVADMRAATEILDRASRGGWR